MRKLTIYLVLQFIWLVAPAQEQWFSNDDISGLNPPTGFAARNHAVSFVIGDTAYIGTGDEGITTRTDFWKYVPATKTWTQIADFPGNKRKQAVAFTLNGKGYVGTGRSGTTLFDDFYSYDPVTNSWDTIAAFGGGERRNAVAFVVNGKAYVGTGYNTSNAFSTTNVNVTDDLWEYDPVTDQWTERNSILSARGDAMAFSMNGKGYIAGGYGNDTRNIYEYDPSNDSYTKGFTNDFMYDRKDGVAFVLDNKAYIGLGIKQPTRQTTDFFVFSSVFLEVTSQATDDDVDEFGDATENNRIGAISFVIRGKAFVGLGGYVTTGTASKKDLWSYQTPTPDAPENLTLTTPTQTSATLRWTSHANNETGYRIERSENNTSSFSLANGGYTNVDTTEYQQTALPVDKEFFYRVRTVNATHQSAYSDTVLANTYTPPSGLTATVASATEITLNWQDNSNGELGFIIQRTTNGSFSQLATVSADVTTYLDATAELGLDYTYRVLARATKSNSAPSNTVTAGSLTNPTELAAEAADGAVQLTWTYSGNNAGRFIIERRITGGSAFAEVANITATASPNYQDEAVEEASPYEYRVKAENLPRTSTYSANASVSTLLLNPTLVVATVKDSTVVISWTDVSKQETHYVVQRSLGDGSGTVVLDTLVADASSFVDNTSLDTGDYRYAVQAIGATVNSNLVVSNTITIAAPPKQTETPGEEEPNDPEEPAPGDEVVTDTDEMIDRDEIEVYPNPSTGQVKVYVGSEQTAYLAVFNSQGRLVKEVQQAEQSSSATVQLDLQHLPVGVYTLRVYTSQGLFVKKIARR
ncbi:MAG: T9SS type A sorting domain-containing protein [Tunicatimonas sp.]